MDLVDWWEVGGGGAGTQGQQLPRCRAECVVSKTRGFGFSVEKRFIKIVVNNVIMM